MATATEDYMHRFIVPHPDACERAVCMLMGNTKFQICMRRQLAGHAETLMGLFVRVPSQYGCLLAAVLLKNLPLSLSFTARLLYKELPGMSESCPIYAPK